MERKEVEGMLLAEKVSILSGVGTFITEKVLSLNIGGLFMTDGPHGVRREHDNSGILTDSYVATCFPCACLSVCSFDRDLMYCLGVALGKESLDLEVDILLGPAMNIKRNPLCGRNFEYFSEDPLLSGEIGFFYSFF
jgi:beta-glucosidase